MILRTLVALYSDVKETTQCIRIFVKSASVIFAVYFPTWCRPCIIQKTQVLIFVFVDHWDCCSMFFLYYMHYSFVERCCRGRIFTEL